MSLPEHVTHDDLERWMRAALAEADVAGSEGDLPIGAVLAIDGEDVARGRSRRATTRNQLAHAELAALLAGGERLWADHNRVILVTTLEPCPMCLGAAVMADVPHVVFGSRDALVCATQMVEAIPYIRNHIRAWLGGVLEAEILAVMMRHDPQLLRLATGATQRHG